MNVKVNLSTPPHLIWDTVNSEGEKVVRWYEKHANKLGGEEHLKLEADRNIIDDPKHRSRVVFQQDWTSPPHDTPDGKKEHNLYNCIDIVHYFNKACFYSQSLIYLYYKTNGSAGMYLIWELDEDEKDAGGTTMPHRFVVCFTSHFFLRYCDTERKMGTMNRENPEQILVDFFLRNRFGISTRFMRQYNADGMELVDICLSGCVGRGKVRRTDDSDVVMYEFDTCLAWKMLHPKQYREMKVVIEAYAHHVRQKIKDADEVLDNVKGDRGHLLEGLEREALREIVKDRRYAAKVMKVVTRLRDYVQYMIQFADPAVNKGRDVYDYLRDYVQAYVTGAYHITNQAICENMSPSEFEDLFLTALVQIIDRYNVPVSAETVEEKFFEKEGGKAPQTQTSNTDKVPMTNDALYDKCYRTIAKFAGNTDDALFKSICALLFYETVTHVTKKLIRPSGNISGRDFLMIRMAILAEQWYKSRNEHAFHDGIISEIGKAALYHGITSVLPQDIEQYLFNTLHITGAWIDAIIAEVRRKNNTNNNRTNNNDIMNDKQITEFKALVKKQLKNFDKYVKTATGLTYDSYLRQVEPLFAIDRILSYITVEKDNKKAVDANVQWTEMVVDNRWCSMLEPYIKESGKELVNLAIEYMKENNVWQCPKGKAQLQAKDWDYSSLEDIRQAVTCVCENEDLEPMPEVEEVADVVEEVTEKTGLIEFESIEASDDLHVSIDTAQQELKAISISISRLKQSAARLANFVASADPDIDASQKATAELLNENETLRSQLETKKADVDSIKAERDENQRIINDLRNQLNAAVQERKKLETKEQDLLKLKKKQADALIQKDERIKALEQQIKAPEPFVIEFSDIHGDQPFLSVPSIHKMDNYLRKRGIAKVVGFND